jgi:VIT1/CCC1 family predicted Fe2+/Mn2+ transporter
MAREMLLRKTPIEPHKGASRLRDFILGGQDGLVNVLGVVLGVATATKDVRLILIAAIAATFAESISMMAVAYTSFKAESDFYRSEVRREQKEMRDMPDVERQEVRTIFRHMGFTKNLLESAVKHITSNRKRWLDTMMELELKMTPPKVSPLNVAIVVGLSALVGSLIPIIPFFFLPIDTAILASLVISTTVLFFVGIYKAMTTVGSPLRSGIEMAVIGMLAALAGYAVGAISGVIIH